MPYVKETANQCRRLTAARLVLALALLAAPRTALAAEAGVFNVRDYGAVGDGRTLDTAALHKAVSACAEAGGGQVRFPPGRYLSATVHLKSRVTLYLEAGARLVGVKDPNLYQYPTPPAFLPEAKWGKWHRALILADGAEDIEIAGSGVIDGNKVFDPTGEERMRGPHTFVFVNCRDVTIRDVSFVDAANYAIFFQISDHVDIRNVKFTGGWDGVHFRGAPQQPCKDVSIVGCRFYTGDDSIAGRYWENVVISDCIVNSSCNGIRLIGPATHLIVRDCLFYGPGVQPHRSSNRYNMLAGVNLQPGAWDRTTGDLDDVLISDITMQNVSTPFHFMMKPGNTANRITVTRVTATGVYRAASSVESWADAPFKNVTFRDIDIEFEGGGILGKIPTQVKAPGVDARPLPAWGFYARNVENLTFEDFRMTCTKPDQRPVMICEDVNQLTLDTFRFTQCQDVNEPVVLNRVASVHLSHTDLPSARK
ncbi:MAG: right-handed parallel beta-helix repeat-containing protein [Planctomycetes bacterium]|nr:right-handed parallel beta-helix repeat-containing protein [Planctomycetota bacterium]